MWIENAWAPQLQRIRDQPIMTAFLKVKHKGATAKKLEWANLCRLYLQVVTVAELADENGLRISPE